MNDKILISFLTEISAINAQLRKLEIVLENSKVFRSVDRNCDIQKFGEQEPELYIGIEANLFNPLDDDLHAAGMSFRVFRKEGRWLFDGDVGWSSYDTGYKMIDSLEIFYGDINGLLQNLQRDYATLVEKYNLLIDGYRQTLSNG